jgi:hypothetical protein
MNTFRHDDEQRRQWVQDKLTKQKSVKQICKEAQISRATLYNWIDEFKKQSAVNSNQWTEVQENAGEKQEAIVSETDSYSPTGKTLPVHHAGTKHRMLLAALEKVDSDKSIARKLAATLVKRFTLSIAQACEITGIDEATYGYKPRKPEVDDRLVQQSIVQLLAKEPTTNFNECCITLRKANPNWTRKQIKRVYREGRLYLKRQRGGNKKSGVTPVQFPIPIQRPGACWNLGILQNRQGYMLFILDDADSILLNTASVKGTITQEQIDNFLNRAITENGKPRRLRIPDKEPFNVRQLTAWAFTHKISMLKLSMGKPENELEVQGMEESVKEQIEGIENILA